LLIQEDAIEKTIYEVENSVTLLHAVTNHKLTPLQVKKHTSYCHMSRTFLYLVPGTN